MANLLDRASVVLTPTAYNNGEALCIKPDDGSGDFDFSRNSAATRVNAQGLVENVQILSSNLVQNGDFSEEGAEEVSNGSFSQEGSELVTNGDFATDSDWVKTSQVTIENGIANIVSNDGSFQVLVQNNVVTTGKYYVLTYTIVSSNSGSLKFSSLGQINSTIGTHKIYFVATETAINIARNSGITDISIDNVSVREVGQDWVLGTGWSIGDGVANYDGLQAYQQLRQGTVNGVIGKNYLVKYTVSDNNGVGGIQVKFGGVNLSSYNSSNGSFEFYVQAISTDYIRLTPELDFNGSITNISVKEVGQDWDILNDVTSFSFENGIANIQGTANSPNNGIKQASISAVIGKTYKISATLRSNDGGLYRFRLLDGSYFDLGSGNSTEFETITSYHTATSTAFTIFASSWYTSGTSNFDISNISVIEITTDTSLPRINYEGFSYQDALGSEEVVNGTFDSDTAWSKGAGWSIANGEATHTGSASYLSQSILNPNTQYKVKIKVSQASGSNFVQIYMGGSPASVLIQNVGEYEYIFTSQSSIGLGFALRGAGNVGIDNVSVKEYLGQEVVPDSGCGSWLFEPQSTNLVTQSELFSDSYWSKINSSVTSGFSSPSGGLNAFKLVENTSLGNHVVRKSGLTTASTTTTSIFAKAEQRNKILLFNGVAGYGFNLSNGTTFATSTGIPDAFNITELNNGWYKCSITHSSANRCSVYLINDADSFSYTGDGTSGVYIFGAQVELGTGTSYIPTSGTTVTRNQDLCTNGGSLASINSTEGVLYAEVAAFSNSDTFYIGLFGGSLSRVRLAFSPNRIRGELYDGAFQGIVESFINISNNNKVAFKYKENDFALWINGVEVDTDNSGLTFSSNTLTYFNLSGVQGNIFNINGKTKALAVWKEALSDEELTELTTI